MSAALPTTVLFVDDDAAWRVVLDRWFKGAGLRSIGLARGEWITHAIKRYRPDVVLLDMHLSGRNGLCVLDEVRGRWATLPVIVMTAFGGKYTADLALQLGATGYLDKPFRMEQLTAELRRVVGRPAPGNEPSPCA